MGGTGRIALRDVELSRPLVDIDGLDGYTKVETLVRLHGAPVGSLRLPVLAGRCQAGSLARAIADSLSWPVIRHLLCDALAQGRCGSLSVAELAGVPHPDPPGTWPSVTVAVCTRDRPHYLGACLSALEELEYPDLDILVVDNSPTTDRTLELVRSRFPKVRYVREPRPGLDWARNRAIAEAQGDVLAFTDDDVIVDPGWVRALAAVFAESPEVSAVTGLVVPHDLEGEAQILFEQYGGFNRGYERRWFQVDRDGGERPAKLHGGSGKFGTGANMAFRRKVFEAIGPFDPALDVGTVTNGAGDLEMFFRVLNSGNGLAYEPSALVRHRHRETMEQLHEQLTNHGVGFYSYVVRNMLAGRAERWPFFRLGAWWFWRWSVRRLVATLIRPTQFPRALVMAELKGSIQGLGRYPRARRDAARIEQSFGPIAGLTVPRPEPLRHGRRRGRRVAVRRVDVAEPLRPLTGLDGYSDVRLYILKDGAAIGSVDLRNLGHDVGVRRQQEAIVDRLGIKLLEDAQHERGQLPYPEVASTVMSSLLSAALSSPARMSVPPELSASVVIATYDRPDALRACLEALVAQRTARPWEIIVVDNHPESGLTPPVVARFADIRLLAEPRQGLSYARNRGIVASTGSIVITTDDDVVVPEGWLEALLRPFGEPDVMVVTGLTLPSQLESQAEQLFERYGGLGRGFDRRRFGPEWAERFKDRAVPTWELGGTANAAFRSEIFGHPDIGLFDEALGAGTPTGCSEDTYLFYKVLKAGYAVVYEPAATAWHSHRATIEQLRSQLYCYSKGHVAYHLTTLTRDRDLRAVVRLGLHLPMWRVRQVGRWLTRRSDYPMALISAETAGNLVGPVALWRSRRRVLRDGPSDPYLAGAHRPKADPATSGPPLVARDRA